MQRRERTARSESRGERGRRGAGAEEREKSGRRGAGAEEREKSGHLSPHFFLLTSHFFLLTSHFFLLTSHFSLFSLTPHSSLLTSHFSLLTSHFSLLAPYFSLLDWRFIFSPYSKAHIGRQRHWETLEFRYSFTQMCRVHRQFYLFSRESRRSCTSVPGFLFRIIPIKI